jgi:hypothetical protein
MPGSLPALILSIGYVRVQPDYFYYQFPTKPHLGSHVLAWGWPQTMILLLIPPTCLGSRSYTTMLLLLIETESH